MGSDNEEILSRGLSFILNIGQETRDLDPKIRSMFTYRSPKRMIMYDATSSCEGQGEDT